MCSDWLRDTACSDWLRAGIGVKIEPGSPDGWRLVVHQGEPLFLDRMAQNQMLDKYLRGEK